MNISDITTPHWQHQLGTPDGVVTGVNDVDQAIRIILTTPKGADPHRPEFGSGIWHYIDWPINRALPHLVREGVDAIRTWEPRVVVDSVSAQIDGEHMTLVVAWHLADGVARNTEVVVK